MLLVRRRTAVGLGQALVLIAALEEANYLCGGLADAIAGGTTPPPLAARLLSLHESGGDEGNRTPNPRLAKAVLCQLSYVPWLRPHT